MGAPSACLRRGGESRRSVVIAAMGLPLARDQPGAQADLTGIIRRWKALGLEEFVISR
jgi:hypothetical protein